jgi:hypothetical protein
MLRSRKTAVLVAGAVLALGAGVAYATIPDNAGVIHGCYSNENGLLRVVDSTACRTSETAVSWNQQGVPGPPGPPGPPGAPAHVLWAKFGEGPPPFLIGDNGAVTSVERLRTGVFRLSFKQDVSACAYEATLVTAGPINGAVFDLPKGEVSAGTDFTNGAGNPTAVDVQVATSSGVLSDNVGSVALAVFC